MLNFIEDQFAAAARTPKGARALRAIFKATRQSVGELGLDAASLDIIASRAGLTQAALRHYYPTRDDLLTAFFVAATEWFRERVEEILASDNAAARDKLERCVSWHIEYMESVDTAFWLEAQAFWLRTKSGRQIRDSWYRWLLGELSDLIGKIHPSLGLRERQRRAYAILTLTLGAWITHGKGSRLGDTASVVEQRQLLIETALEITNL
jgi:AcrR family transcriptional regulator